MEHSNPYRRLAGYGKLKRIINSYQDSQITGKDRNLIRGIFVKKIKDFKED
jgi:hypothetical protein